jgi:hypothetical protein
MSQPAFPPNAGWRDADENARGMSLRDYFAAQALAGLLASPTTDEDTFGTIAMIEARNVKESA